MSLPRCALGSLRWVLARFRGFRRALATSEYFVGMDAPTFALTDAHREFRDTLRRFAEDRVAPNATQADRDATFPQKSFDACVELELPALGIPVEYGGAGADMVTQAIMAEELARVCASTSLTLLISKPACCRS